MSTLAFTPTVSARSHRGRPLFAILHTLTGYLAQVGSTWQAERALARLDDAALHDMGLVRSEIGRAVREGRPQR